MTALSRAALLGAASALALAGPRATAAACAASKAGSSDADLLNAALALERALVKAYDQAAAANVLSPPVLAVLRGFAADHTAHLAALSAAVSQTGGTPSADTATLPAPTLDKEEGVLGYALTLERQAASTYLDTLSAFKNRDLAKTAGSILGVETTHVALLAEALRANPAYPSSFVTPV